MLIARHNTASLPHKRLRAGMIAGFKRLDRKFGDRKTDTSGGASGGWNDTSNETGADMADHLTRTDMALGDIAGIATQLPIRS